LKESLNRFNLEVGMLAAMADLIKEDLTMGHPEAAVRQKFLHRAPTHLKLAAALDAVIPIGFTRGFLRPGMAKQDLDDWFMETLDEYARMAQDLGVTLILEPINRYEINFINRVDEALKFVETLDRSNLKLLLDAFHMNIEEVSIPLSILQAGNRIGHFHFVDSNRWPPGYGHTDMKEIFFCLKEVDYQGFFAVEAVPMPDSTTGARGGLEYIQMLERMWEETRQKQAP
jgi:sugar phosphate isomerase/epimerase